MITSHRQPKQLKLFPTAVRLTKVVLEDNQRRFYLMRTTPTLFGEWSLLREWGRIGSPGRLRLETHGSMGGGSHAVGQTCARSSLGTPQPWQNNWASLAIGR